MRKQKQEEQSKAESEKQKRTSQSSRPKLAILYRELSERIEKKLETDGIEFPKNYYVYKPSGDTRLLVKEVAPGLVAMSSREELAADILEYNNTYYGGSDLYAFTLKQAIDCADYFKTVAKPLPEAPPLFAEKSRPGLAFHRLEFDFDRNGGDTPYFDSFINRASDPHALKSFLGSIFCPQSPNHQYLYLYGIGQDGKGTLARNLQWMLGQAFQSRFVPDKNSARFWADGLLTARLCVIPESDSLGFCGGSYFKTLTGGDPVLIEPKGKPAFTAILNCKFIVTSNTVPSIEDSKANRRRMLYVELKTIPDEDMLPEAIIAAKLREEAPSFYGKCIAEYESRYRDHSGIVSNYEAFESQVGSSYDEDFEVIAATHLRIIAGGRMSLKKMREIKKVEKMDRYTFARWLEFLRRKFGIAKRKDDAVRFYDGVEYAGGESGDASLRDIPF